MDDNWVFKIGKGKYLNLPISLDTESTSYVTDNGKKLAWMYVWMINFNGEFITGRTWMEFAQWYVKFVEEYRLNLKRRAVIYVHNLAFDFQFFRCLFEWEQVFSLDKRKVVYAVTKQGVEFRCSYILTNKSLENLAEDVKSKKIEKLKGDLDYTKVRHSETPLTDEEWGYCRNDVDIVTSYIREQIEKEGDITKIPLTATGYVRRAVKKNCFKNKSYSSKIKKMQLTVEEYKMLKTAFAGGFTHANAEHSGVILENVKSYDFTSAYPAVMLSEQFPMSSGVRVERPSKRDLIKYMKKYCCMFEITFSEIRRKDDVSEDYISASKCTGTMIIENNGRVNSAKLLTSVITDMDFKIITKVYDFDDFDVGVLYYYTKDYLPREILECCVEFYKNKTELKDVEDREEDYLVAKGMLNSIYGMMVTDINRDEIIYADDVWSSKEPSLEECIEKYNKGSGRFLHYPWGVWITAYNRFNLWSAILECGSDHVYSDTDSEKFLNWEKHLEYFEKYNYEIITKIKACCLERDINIDDLNPKDIKGKHHMIGVWADDGFYNKFKTLGAKRYLTLKEKDGEQVLGLTVAGVSKEEGCKYLQDEYGLVGAFEAFSEELVFPPGKGGKLIHTYIDELMECEVVDYLGNKGFVSEYSGLHLEASEYSMNISEKYKEFMKNSKRMK